LTHDLEAGSISNSKAMKTLDIPELVWWTLRRPFITYGRKPPFVLLNGLAEQQETWFRNISSWGPYVEVFMPGILVFDGCTLQEKIRRDEELSVEYLVGELFTYITRFIQRTPVILGGSSTGAKVAVSFAAQYPELVSGLVLFGPAGFSDKEQLPIMAGVRKSDARTLVESVFYNPRLVDPGLISFYGEAVRNRAWKKGLLRAVRGTLGYSVTDALAKLHHPILAFVGAEDHIVDADQTLERLRKCGVECIVVPDCGHAPHLERPGITNRETVKFLKRFRTQKKAE
jgi:pimeloyl-ACP methyl ester carboxylesterase